MPDGAVIHDPLGVDVTVTEDGSGCNGEYARATVVAEPGGNGGRSHIHMHQAERYSVATGSLLLWRDGRADRVGVGQTAVVPPGTCHNFRAEERTLFTVEFRPALRIMEFFDVLFSMPAGPLGELRLRDTVYLMRRYPREFLYRPGLFGRGQVCAAHLLSFRRRRPSGDRRRRRSASAH